MIEIRKFTETNKEFKEIVRIENLIRHDSICHFDYLKKMWSLRGKNIIKDKILLYNDNLLIGILNYWQGRKQNKSNTFFTIYLDPLYNELGYRKVLYKNMLEKIKKYNSKKLFPHLFDHPNYKHFKNFLIKNDFTLVQTNKEYSLDITNDMVKEYPNKIENLNVKIYDSRDEMKYFPKHYKKLEELSWETSKDYPRPDGIVISRIPFNEFMEIQKYYEDHSYGIQLVAVKGEKYIGMTSLSLYPKSDPHKAWTEGLGVIREFRRKGIATALKIKAIECLQKKGVKEIRTDNEENNPMYKINVALGFKPVPFLLEYLKKIK